MSQCDLILDYLKSGKTLTPATAFSMFGTLACHSRISELRARGYDIHCEIVKTPSGKHVGSYTLRGQMELAAA